METLRTMRRRKTPTQKEIHQYLVRLAKRGNDSQKRELYDILMTDLFHSVSLTDLDRSFEALPKATQDILLGDADMLAQSSLYKWLSEEIVRLLERRIYLDSKNDFEIAINKMGLWVEKNRDMLLKRLLEIAKKKQFIHSMKKY